MVSAAAHAAGAHEVQRERLPRVETEPVEHPLQVVPYRVGAPAQPLGDGRVREPSPRAMRPGARGQTVDSTRQLQLLNILKIRVSALLRKLRGSLQGGVVPCGATGRGLVLVR